MRVGIRSIALGLSVSVALSQPISALAWGAQGHQVVAELALAHLSEPARREFDRLLTLEPGETLASISTWADVHQPLHAGYRDDKGGNAYQVQAFGRGSNLHALWDSGLIKSLDEDVDALTARLKRAPGSKGASDLDPVHAAEESCQVVGKPGFYPERKVPAAYVDRYRPTLEERLRMAGSRLAGVLNQAMN